MELMINTGGTEITEKKPPKQTKVVIYPVVARKLLKLGYMIIDIKPKKEDLLQSLFVFYVEGCFWRDYDRLMREYEDYLAKKALEAELAEQELEKEVEKYVQRDFTSRLYSR